MKKARRRKVIDDHLRRLERSMGDLPSKVRRELVVDARGQIEEAWAASAERTEAALRSILERVGSPEVRARKQRERVTPKGRGPWEGSYLIALAAVFSIVLVWPLGIALAWLSSRWSRADKLVATAFPLVGLLLLYVSLTPASATLPPQPLGIPIELPGELPPAPGLTSVPEPSLLVSLVDGGLMVLRLGAPLLAAIYLTLRMRPRPRRSAILLPVISGVLVLLGLLVIVLAPAGGGVSG